MKLTVTKRFEFAYAHFLPGYEGDCANLHGHTGILEVEVSPDGNVRSSYEGMVIDFKELKSIVQDEVLNSLDHCFLNDVLDGGSPTAENIARFVWQKLEKKFGEGLQRIRVYETPTSWAEVRR